MIAEVIDGQISLIEALAGAYQRRSRIKIYSGRKEFRCFVMEMDLFALTQSCPRVRLELIVDGKPVKKRKRAK